MIWTLPAPSTGATLAGELRAALLAAVLFLGLLGIAETWRRTHAPKPEWTRKFVHMGSGAVAAFFPWMFRTHWTLLALGAVMIALFVWGRSRGWFASVTGVERVSAGERWFPVGVYLLYVIARRQPVFYLIALSSLVVSDSLAALLGARYGTHTFAVVGGRKSLEGSAVFLLATFVGVLVMLGCFTPTGRLECVVIAAQLALLATAFEAISQHGNDNLVLPLASYYLLIKLTQYPWQGTALQLAAQIGLLVLCLLIASRTRFLSFAGALAAHLVLYATFSLGGPGWTLSPALALAGYLLVSTARERDPHLPRGGHQVQGVFYVSIAAIVLLFCDNTLGMLPRTFGFDRPDHPLLALFVGALAAPLAITFAVETRYRRLAGGVWVAQLLLGSGAAIVTIAPLGLWAAGSHALSRDCATIALLVVVSVACFLGFSALWREPRTALREFRLRSASVGAAVLVVTPLHLLWVRRG